MNDSRSSEFSRQAEGRSSGLLGELWGYLGHNKKWWLTPIILVLLVLGFLMIFGGGVAAPFIYTLF